MSELKNEYAWAKMTDLESGITCHVLETNSGLFYGFNDNDGKPVPDDVVPAQYWKGSAAQWAAMEMLRRKINGDTNV